MCGLVACEATQRDDAMRDANQKKFRTFAAHFGRGK
jgi:hypothetical protein